MIHISLWEQIPYTNWSQDGLSPGGGSDFVSEPEVASVAL